MSTVTTERPKTVENLKVLQVGKFGIRVDEKTWFGVNEPLTPSHFSVGASYKVSVTTSKTGKKYVNEIIGVDVAVPSVQTVPVVDTTTAVSTNTVQRKDMTISSASSTVMDLKTRQIQRQGSFQAALQSPFLGQTATNITEYLLFVRQAAEAAVQFINE